jgi:hypothetical protein
MLRVTADVNGERVETILIQNTGTEGGDVWRYDAASWNHVSPDDSIIGVEGIFHHRGQGWKKLTRIVSNVLDDIARSKR